LISGQRGAKTDQNDPWLNFIDHCTGDKARNIFSSICDIFLFYSSEQSGTTEVQSQVVLSPSKTDFISSILKIAEGFKRVILEVCVT